MAAAPAQTYRRDSTTWAAFGALFAFGFLNAVLGPALPYIREAEGISYVVGALHQVAYAVGGGLAGLLAARERGSADRRTVIAGGLAAAALFGFAVGYGGTPALTIGGAFFMSFLGTSALIRVWAVLADVHGDRRAVAMTEGEVPVSLAGIITPLLIGVLATTALSWRFAFVVGAVATWLAALQMWRVKVPAPADAAAGAGAGVGAPDGVTTDDDAAAAQVAARSSHRRWVPQPTLVIVFAIVALEFTLAFWLATYLNDEIGIALDTAVAAVGGLHAAMLTGRLLASRLSRRFGAELLLGAALVTALLGLPVLLVATGPWAAAVGIAVTGTGIGAMFPLTSALHVEDSPRGSDGALGQVLSVAAIGQIAGPLAAGAIAQAADLRAGLLVLPAVTLIALAALRRRR